MTNEQMKTLLIDLRIIAEQLRENSSEVNDHWAIVIERAIAALLPAHEPLEQRLSPRAMVAIDANAQPAGGAESTAGGSNWERQRAWRHELTFNVHGVNSLHKLAEEMAAELERVTWELHMTRPGACTECWGFNGDHQPHSCRHWIEGASRDASSEPASVIDWPNKCCTKCRKPLVYESQPAHYAGWRLDCVCWDEPPAQRTLEQRPEDK